MYPSMIYDNSRASLRGLRGTKQLKQSNSLSLLREFGGEVWIASPQTARNDGVIELTQQ